jgi:hypothetical protein
MQYQKGSKDLRTIISKSDRDSVRRRLTRKARQGLGFAGCMSGDGSQRGRLVVGQVYGGLRKVV